MSSAAKYRVSLAALEAEAHVRAEDQVEEQATDHPHDYTAPEELDRVRLLSTAAAGRLRVQ